MGRRVCKLNSLNDHFRYIKTGVKSEFQHKPELWALETPTTCEGGQDMEPAPRRSRETHLGESRGTAVCPWPIWNPSPRRRAAKWTWQGTLWHNTNYFGNQNNRPLISSIKLYPQWEGLSITSVFFLPKIQNLNLIMMKQTPSYTEWWALSLVFKLQAVTHWCIMKTMYWLIKWTGKRARAE